MNHPGQNVDFLIVGAGIIGLTLARELRSRHPDCSILILEKEADVGHHASGRNSGVLHSGIYYPETSLKAKVCIAGGRELTAYCQERNLPFQQSGKVIVPVRSNQDAQLDLLYQRGLANGVRVEMLDRQALREVEPVAGTATGRALYSLDTAVFDPKAVLKACRDELVEAGIVLRYEQTIQQIDPQARLLKTQDTQWQYGHLFNTAGLHADRIAQACEVGRHYAILPFKGLYYALNPDSGLQFKRLIYPVPDLRMPFLGVHFTKVPAGNVYAGPTAIPAFGRENYTGLQDVNLVEGPRILASLARQYWQNQQNFREYTHQEALRAFKPNFVQAAQALVPGLKSKDLIPCSKVGIRAQLLDLRNQQLVMDFLVENGPHSTHILNAVSPAFTSAFAFSRFVLEQCWKE